MPQPVTIVIVDKNATLKTLAIKDYKEEELYKKCGFKKPDEFALQTEWSVKIDKQKYVIAMYGKTDGKANMENNYNWPPPVDKVLYFGSCCIVGMICEEKTNNKSFINLSVELWNIIYEKLFGGFEDLTTTCNDDDDEEDELDAIPASMKTKKGGYLKDGFVVDSSDTEEMDLSDEDDDELILTDEPEEEGDGDGEELILEDIGSELSEEKYDYSDDE